MFNKVVKNSKIALAATLFAIPFGTMAEDAQFNIAAPQINAQTYVLMDYNSGAVLASLNPDQRQYPASLTKMMTIILEKAKNQNRKHIRYRFSIPNDDLDAVVSVANYINDHYATDIRIDFLSQIACMSPAKLKYIFKDVYHMSIQQYIVTRRITHAEHLLRDTVLPVSLIAEMVGYKYISSLSDMFRQHTGMKPTEYRKKCR